MSETDVAQVHTGQSAQVHIDALGSQVITGTVNYIAPAATTAQNVTTYRVRVNLPQDNKSIRVGMSASVEIGTSQKSNILLIPASAVRTVGAKRLVRKQQTVNGKVSFADTEVKTGTSNDVDIEVISGLNEGDTIATLGTAGK